MTSTILEVRRPVLPGIMIALGGLLHLVVLVAPNVAWYGIESLTNAVCLIFLLGATAFYGAEMSRSSATTNPAQREPLVSFRRPLIYRLALATGLALLVLQWTALVTASGTERFCHVLVPHWILQIVSVVGLMLMLGGSLLRLVAIRCLGCFFVTELTTSIDQPLVTKGPYRRIRHPSETGLLAYALGVCLLLESPFALLVWVAVLLPLGLVRIWLEDRYLAHIFGDSFTHYARHTGRLLPRLNVEVFDKDSVHPTNV